MGNSCGTFDGIPLPFSLPSHVCVYVLFCVSSGTPYAYYDVQSITCTLTSGSFVITYGTATSSAIPYNAAVTAVQNALLAIPQYVVLLGYFVRMGVIAVLLVSSG